MLSGNNFYTTVAARISNGILDGAVTASELIDKVKAAEGGIQIEQ